MICAASRGALAAEVEAEALPDEAFAASPVERILFKASKGRIRMDIAWIV
ncbi:MAG: hypothetical protein DHS20C06_16170 [Hyphobacterium sp.]|nr:MAG: hypothetical protein DHS20C06_16170 [Hyphobacterium sp.]